jgi:hypothetical protein
VPVTSKVDKCSIARHGKVMLKHRLVGSNNPFYPVDSFGGPTLKDMSNPHRQTWPQTPQKLGLAPGLAFPSQAVVI